MKPTTTARLLLDEMFSPNIAENLRVRGHDVLAVAERIDLRAMTDEDLFAWANSESRWLLTENVKDFRPIMKRALQAGASVTGLLFTSSRTFPRSRRNPGQLVEAIDSWMTSGSPPPPLTEDWLVRRDGH